MTIHFGTFLLMQSPSARPSQEMYARAIEIAQAAEAPGFHHPLVVAEEIATLDQLAGGRRHSQGVPRRAVQLRRKALQDP